ncbi:MAG: G5 domain-containing protein [Clostridia bacterium]|nr:G5 domain-containing protein [Clostridia bacterium]
MNKIIGYLKSCFSLKSSIICSIALVFAISAITLMLNLCKYEITISEDGKVKQAFVYSTTVEDALKEAGIKVSEFDELSLDRNANLKKEKKIEIIRAKEVALMINGNEEKIFTTLPTVSDVLDALSIEIGEDSILITPADEKVANGLKIEIAKKVYEEITETEVIPFSTIKKANYNMDSGKTRVAKAGVDGEKKSTYRVLKHNGVVLEKELILETVTKKPVDKVVEYGVIASVPTSRGGDIRAKKVIDCRATAYCLKGTTASGVPSQKGVVAVDPSVIPLGTRLYIEGADGSFSYGYAVAGDTGGSIKGNKIDLFFDTRSECIQFGVKNVKVYILE